MYCHNQGGGGKPWVVRDTPRSVHAVFADGGLCPIRGSKIDRRLAAIPGARKNGIENNALNGISEMGITLKRTTCKKSLILNLQLPT
jgi:hypothetical protein